LNASFFGMVDFIVFDYKVFLNEMQMLDNMDDMDGKGRKNWFHSVFFCKRIGDWV